MFAKREIIFDWTPFPLVDPFEGLIRPTGLLNLWHSWDKQEFYVFTFLLFNFFLLNYSCVLFSPLFLLLLLYLFQLWHRL